MSRVYVQYLLLDHCSFLWVCSQSFALLSFTACSLNDVCLLRACRVSANNPWAQNVASTWASSAARLFPRIRPHVERNPDLGDLQAQPMPNLPVVMLFWALGHVREPLSSQSHVHSQADRMLAVTNFLSIFTWYVSYMSMYPIPFLLVSFIYALPPLSPWHLFHPFTQLSITCFTYVLPLVCYSIPLPRSHNFIYINSSIVVLFFSLLFV